MPFKDGIPAVEIDESLFTRILSSEPYTRTESQIWVVGMYDKGQ